jgi:CheY-like chemotaxis protein
MNVMIYFSLLKSLGVSQEKIEVASNGREALIKATRFPYDIILMDLDMPEMNGFDSCA